MGCYISVISLVYLKFITRISQVYFGYISGILQIYFRHTLNKSQAYLSYVLGISKVYLRCISVRSWVKLTPKSLVDRNEKMAPEQKYGPFDNTR